MMRKLVLKYELWKKRKRTQRELYSLSDRELHDLGICREDISRIVNQQVS